MGGWAARATASLSSRLSGWGRDATVFWLLTVLSTVVFALRSGVYLDDVYVYLRVAENLAQTGQPIFNEGDSFNITTSPAWLMIVAAVAKMASPQVLPMLIKVLFVGLLVGASCVLRAILRPKAPNLAMLSALPVFFAPHISSLAGMETSLALFSGLGLILSFQRRDRWTPLWVAVFYLSRPEGLVLGGLLGVVLVIEAIRERNLLPAVRSYGVALLLGGILVGTWQVWLLRLSGDLVPATAGAKLIQGSAGWTTFAQAWPEHLKLIWEPADPLWVNCVRSLIAAIGIIGVGRLAWPLIAWPIGHFGIYAGLGVAYYHWYYYVVDFVLALGLVAGLLIVVEPVTRLLGRKSGAWVVMAGTMVVLAALALPMVRTHVAGLVMGPNVAPSPRFDSYTRLASAMDAATGGKPFTLLSHEVGILGYLLPQAEVRDVVGLATPVETAVDLWNWGKQVRAFGPEFILTPFPTHGRPQIYERSDGSLVRYDVFLVDGKWTVLRMQDPASPEAAAFREEESRARSLVGASVSTGATAEILAVEGRLVVFAHSPAKFVVTPPRGVVALELGFGFRPEVNRPGRGSDGARFLVRDVSSGELLFERRLNPSGRPADLQPQRAVIEMSGEPIEIIIDPLGTTSWDWTFLEPLHWLGAEVAKA